mmetsp:Transcript_28393/g.27334  ORF Transcript_28393/g.27334 Transcript_28393/m.27334 type:complete len:149 (+) Transcript_28393:438-884(+)
MCLFRGDPGDSALFPDLLTEQKKEKLLILVELIMSWSMTTLEDRMSNLQSSNVIRLLFNLPGVRYGVMLAFFIDFKEILTTHLNEQVTMIIGDEQQLIVRQKKPKKFKFPCSTLILLPNEAISLLWACLSKFIQLSKHGDFNLALELF